MNEALIATAPLLPATNTVLLRLEAVVKQRARGESRFELQVPTLTLHEGEFVAVVGESGCGKSTLLDLLALIARPDECSQFLLCCDGTIVNVRRLWVTGADQALAAVRREYLGYVLQTGGLLPYLTVRDNLLLPARMNGLNELARIERQAEILGVASCLDRKPAALSGGQRQRVAILRALSHHPRLILADEPTAAVDKARAKQIVADFRDLALAEGPTVVMVSHDLDLVAPVANRIYGFDLEAVSATYTRAVCRQET